jgi:hypothetical protein
LNCKTGQETDEYLTGQQTNLSIEANDRLERDLQGKTRKTEPLALLAAVPSVARQAIRASLKGMEINLPNH